MSYILVKDVLIFSNQIKIVEEVQSYNATNLQITFIDGSTRFLYNTTLKDIKFGSGRSYEVKG